MTIIKICTAFALLFPIVAWADQIETKAPSELDWKTTPVGVAFAALHGDRFQEPYRAMVKLPAGTISPPHTKTANMYGVVLKGVMTHKRANSETMIVNKVSAGGYYFIAKNTPHISACVSKEPCLAYLYQDGKFDFLPVDE
ncbi:MAG: DUF4437 domain-containing protein [Pseudoruegeria sp.]